MARITDYSSLQSAVENMLHRSDISTYFDQLLQAGENRIYHDVLDRGKGLRAMEKSLSSIIAENELLYSGDLSNAAWAKSVVTVPSSITLAGHTLWTVTGDGGNGRYVYQISPDTIPAGGYVTLRAICSAGTSTQTAIRVENNSADGTERHLLQSINWSAGIPSLDVSTTAGGFDMYGTPQLNDLGGGVYEVILAAVNNSGAAQACRAILYEQWASGSGSSETAYWGEAQVEFSDSFSAYLETLATPYTWSIGNTGLVTFSVAPPAGATIKWSGNYYYLCAFSQDTQTFEQFLDQLFKADVVKLETVTP